jgi:hypothetical protein
VQLKSLASSQLGVVNFFIAADFRVSQAGRPGFLLGGVQWGYFLQKNIFV